MQDDHHTREAQLGVWSHGHKRIRPNDYGVRDQAAEASPQQYAPHTNAPLPAYSEPGAGLSSYGEGLNQTAYRGYDYNPMNAVPPHAGMDRRGGRHENYTEEQYPQYAAQHSQYYHGDSGYPAPLMSQQSTGPMAHYVPQTDWPDHSYSGSASWTQPVAPFDPTGFYGKDASLHLKLQSLSILDNLVRALEDRNVCVFLTHDRPARS